MTRDQERMLSLFTWPPEPSDRARIRAVLEQAGFNPREVAWMAETCPSFEYAMAWIHSRRKDGWTHGFNPPRKAA